MRLSWKRGSAAGYQGPFFVSATRFTYRHQWHMPLVFWHGLRLRGRWPHVEGAVGISIMADFLGRTTYTVSLWRRADDMRRWLGSPAHAPLMRGYRPRLESSAADGWEVDSFDLEAAWRQALLEVGGTRSGSSNAARAPSRGAPSRSAGTP